MAKSKTQFFCKHCGHEEVRWLGQCPGCREWNSFSEVKTKPTGDSKGARGFKSNAGTAVVGPGGKPRLVPLARISSAETSRLVVEPAEVARVLGGGLVEGSVVLLGGDPGIGKSTLLLNLALQDITAGRPDDLRRVLPERRLL